MPDFVLTFEPWIEDGEFAVSGSPIIVALDVVERIATGRELLIVPRAAVDSAVFAVKLSLSSNVAFLEAFFTRLAPLNGKPDGWREAPFSLSGGKE